MLALKINIYRSGTKLLTVSFYDYSTAKLKAEIEARLASIDGWLAELAETGTLRVNSALAGSSSLHEEDVRQ